MIAKALDENGASKVFILGKRKESLEQVARTAVNQSIIAVQCAITLKENLLAAVERIRNKFLMLTQLLPILSTTDSIQKQLWDTSLQDYMNALNVNALGSFYTFVAFMKLLEAGNHHPNSRGKRDFIQSQFITICSIASFSWKKNVRRAYMASKAALAHLTKSLATGFGPIGIRASAIAPGLYITEMTDFVAGGRDLSKPGSLDKVVNPMTRIGTIEDMAGAILFLTSRARAFLNGNIIFSDGGTVGNEPSSY
ncbi:hypothetical protein M433DRAFT_140257 [Acidomyces richmondensis BFW]|nr:MAG: hypothetical protein FE78DRAFT_83304 [Acidomyces sp. 'richmondensis']KYG49250.1 hypothetical protein M433DRAFT_140257 [Acidomyces richmondensis BFW]